MTSSPRTSTKKRKHSDSPPTRKKARLGDDAPATTTPTPVTVQTTAADEEMFAAFLRDVLGDDPPPPLAGTPTVAQTVPATPTPAAGPKPANPFARKVKKLRGNFGTGYHDIAHFQPTQNKSHHGVWDGSRKKVQAWVRLALGSIFDDDGFVAASKPGQNGGHTYLISMEGETVGYLSGSSVPLGTKPPAKHIEVYLDKKGATVSAFPSSPDIF